LPRSQNSDLIRIAEKHQTRSLAYIRVRWQDIGVSPMTDRLDEYRREAEDCRKKAARSPDPSTKAEWLGIAEAWLRMAGDHMSGDSASAPGRTRKGE
jgi:hypothetical protein